MPAVTYPPPLAEVIIISNSRGGMRLHIFVIVSVYKAEYFMISETVSSAEKLSSYRKKLRKKV